MKQAIEKIQMFSADMGGTEIYNGLKKCYGQFKFKNYPNNIFLLTDGDISNPDSVINFVKE